MTSEMVAPAAAGHSGNKVNSLRSPENVKLVASLYKGRAYNPREDREQHVEAWLDSVQDACLTLPNLYKVLNGEITLKPYHENVKALVANGMTDEEAHGMALIADEDS